MDCPDCGAATIAFEIPGELREDVPGEEPTAALCRRCLGLHPTPGVEASAEPDFTVVSDAFPQGEDEGTIAMVLAVGLLDSFALYRREIEALIERVERAGADPLLVLDRLADDPGTEPTVDLRRRRRHLEETLE
jgi:hypothetical protein